MTRNASQVTKQATRHARTVMPGSAGGFAFAASARRMVQAQQYQRRARYAAAVGGTLKRFHVRPPAAGADHPVVPL
jgi:hypothetical protein